MAKGKKRNRADILIDLYLDDQSVLSDAQKDLAQQEIARRKTHGMRWSWRLGTFVSITGPDDHD